MSAVTGGAATGVPPTRQALLAGAAPAATPARLLTTACGLADQIVACGMSSSGDAVPSAFIRGLAAGTATSRAGHGHADLAAGRSAQTSGGPSRVNWLGLQPVEGTPWMVLPMGAGLADGYLGVALFLAQLARLTGVGRYAEVARRAVSPLPSLLGVLGGRADLLVTVGCGAAEGLAGISYALARMSTLLDEPALGEWAEDAVRLTARLVAMSPAVDRPPSGPAPGWPLAVHPAAGAAAAGPATAGPAAGGTPLPAEWLDGLAGCLAAMAAVHAELGSAAAGAVARASADRLAALVEQTDGRCVGAAQPVAPGFAAGPAGIGWALARFGATAAEPSYQEAGRHAVSCAVDPAAGPAAGPVDGTVHGAVDGAGRDGSASWCAGTAGLLVARSCLGGTEPHHEGGLLIQRPMLTDLSLCHGEAGITEALTMLGPAALAPAAQPSSGQAAGGPDVLPPPWRRRAGLIVNAVGRHTRFCGTPGGVPTPGLLRGLAGIGYGLLRAGFTERVPSVLFLEPTPDGGQRG